MTKANRIPGFVVALAGIFLATFASAAPGQLGASAPPKIARDWPTNVPAGRLDGDTISSAFPIDQLPYAISGTTTGFSNDYETECPYSGSYAPDVVYTFTVTDDSLTYTIDMCGSSYDTKIYLYNHEFEVVACNDDYYSGAPCGTYVSKLEDLHLGYHQTYYLVIDGYGGEFGDYVLDIAAYEPCIVPRPVWAQLEGEPPLVEGYIDNFNSGCTGEWETMSYLELYWNMSTWGLWGTSGWYLNSSGNHVDTDWIWFHNPDWWNPLTIVFEAEQRCYAGQLWPQECPGASALQWVLLDPCRPETMVVSQFGSASSAWLWIAPATSSPPEGGLAEFHYTIEVPAFQNVIAQPVPPSADYSLGCPTLPPGESAWSSADDPFTNQFELPPGSCYGGSTGGVDAVFEVYLQAGDNFRCVVGHPWWPKDDRVGQREAVPIYLVKDCRLIPGSCVAVAQHSGNHEVQVDYHAQESGFYYLVYDAFAYDWLSEHLHFHAFVPETSVAPDPPAHDECNGAIEIVPGPIDVLDDLTTARNRFDPGRLGCSGPGGTGRDVVYHLAMVASQDLDVTMRGTTDWDEELYLISDCSDPLNTCVRGCEPDAAGGVHLAYTAETTGDYWLVCDSYGIGERAFRLTGSFAATTAVAEIPAGVQLGPCWPNPFNPRTTIGWSLPRSQSATLTVHDMRGRRVATLWEGGLDAGEHRAGWDGRDGRGRSVAAGVYVARLVTDSGEVRATKLMLAR